MAGSTNTPTALLSMEGVSKSFGAVVALNDATLQLPTGKITGLVGDNGAGKSTLIKIISGVLTPDSGSIVFLGKPANFASPAAAREQGLKLYIRTSRLPEISRYGRTSISAAN